MGGRQSGKETGGVSEEEAQTGLTDKFLSLFPPNALNCSNRSLRLHFFFFLALLVTFQKQPSQ